MSALNVLAERCGIEDSYLDARGNVQTTTAATRQALLGAMGVDAGSEQAALAALESLDREEWLAAAEPVHVANDAGCLSVPVTYAATTKTVAWRLTLENGEEKTGSVQFGSLPLLERRAIDGKLRERRSLILATPVAFGYHTLALSPGDSSSTLIVTPGRCWLPADIEQGRRLWGVAAQLYLLKSNANWGIGDFTDLRELVRMLVAKGADAVGLNPLHAMFLDDPEQASPYSPATRLLLNVLNIDVAAAVQALACAEALGAIESNGFQQELRVGRDGAMLDYSKVARLKSRILELLFKSSSARRESAHWRRFESYRGEIPESAERSCLFLALREHFASQALPQTDWREWPAEFQDPDSAAVRDFAKRQGERVTFQVWLQFLADQQLGEAAQAAEPMAVGLYRDLAVGADSSGAETWSNQRAVVTQAQVGAPPDIYNPAGQGWGLPPFHPRALKLEKYRSFIELVRANMRHAGGLRIDHVMALQQLYWVPRGATTAEGAYVRYPREDLIGILALESHRNQCLVVGEDLGTVPAGFRERMAQARILSYRVLFFEKDKAGFVPPERYPPLSLAVAGSHDLPTLRAWLAASDLALKSKLRLFPSAELEQDAQRTRSSDRLELLQTLRERGLLANTSMTPNQFADAAHAFLASTASAITMIQIDDITGETAPVNVPTTSTEHPNWRRRLSLSLEDIADDPGFSALARLLATARAADLSRR